MASDQFKFDEDWVTEHESTWLKLIGNLSAQPVRVLEIGSWQGRSAIWWLDHLALHPASTIQLCDPCADPGRYTQLMRNLIQHDDFRKCSLARCASSSLLPNMPTDFFDWIYVDGSHEASDVMLDACMSYRAAKRGATIIFDDYGADKTVEPGILVEPRIALDGWLAAHAGLLEVLHTGYQLAVRKI